MTVRRAHLLVLGGCLLAGLLQGIAWAVTAPGVPYKVLADGRFGALPTTSTYHFVGVALFALSGIAIGALLAAGAWQARVARGWPMLLTLVAGSFVGAAIACGLGILFAPGVDPATIGASAADSIVTAPPSTGTWLVILAQPALAAAVYTWLVAWNGQPDLGRGTEPSAAEPTDNLAVPQPQAPQPHVPQPQALEPQAFQPQALQPHTAPESQVIAIAAKGAPS